MTIDERIQECLDKTTRLRQEHPAIKNIRYEIMDVPYEDLREFAESQNTQLHTDVRFKRVYTLYSPWNGIQLDTDIWLYSTVVKIKPAEITEA